jgi:hypothetical protein
MAALAVMFVLIGANPVVGMYNTWQINNNDGVFQIHIKYIDKSVELVNGANSGMTGKQFIEFLLNNSHIPPTRLDTIYCNGRKLSDNYTLQDLGVIAGATAYVTAETSSTQRD